MLPLNFKRGQFTQFVLTYRDNRDLLSVQFGILCVCKTERTHAGVAPSLKY